MKKEEKFYIVNSRLLANTIKFILGEDFEEIPHHTHKHRFVFKFRDSYELQKTMLGIMNLKQEIRK